MEAYYKTAIETLQSIGVPHPYDIAIVMAIFLLIAQFLLNWIWFILSFVFCCRKDKSNADKFIHNKPDFSELGILNSSVKAL